MLIVVIAIGLSPFKSHFEKVTGITGNAGPEPEDTTVGLLILAGEAQLLAGIVPAAHMEIRVLSILDVNVANSEAVSRVRVVSSYSFLLFLSHCPMNPTA